MPYWRHIDIKQAPMATTARFPDELKAEADAYAQRLGVSLNALLAIALRDYLDARSSPGQAARTAHKTAPEPVIAPKSPRERCPCGSGAQWRHCHGK
ncbi:MAG: hypothetical protein B7Y51_06210 [Burkholderiales bacterium 28-67-8]|nr:MAG: hypothetical protein B7Y51_06210 [Burkholderiales bacterium 28-67-8]